jgi:hypothetical protein
MMDDRNGNLEEKERGKVKARIIVIFGRKIPNTQKSILNR